VHVARNRKIREDPGRQALTPTYPVCPRSGTQAGGTAAAKAKLDPAGPGRARSGPAGWNIRSSAYTRTPRARGDLQNGMPVAAKAKLDPAGPARAGPLGNSALPQVLVCIPCPILPKPHVGNEPTLRPDCGGPIREEAGSDGAPPDGGPSPLDPEHLCPSGMIGRLANKSGAPSSHGG